MLQLCSVFAAQPYKSELLCSNEIPLSNRRSTCLLTGVLESPAAIILSSQIKYVGG